MREAVIVSTARTPIGKAYRGAFNDTQAQALAGHAISHAVSPGRRRSGRGRGCDHRCRPAAGRAGVQYRAAGGDAGGLPDTVAGMSVDRQCASGMMAIATAAKQVVHDGMQVAVGGGVESISLVQTGDLRRDRLRDPWLMENLPALYMSMLETAETVADRYGVSREEQDAFALQSQQRTASAQQRGASPTRSCPWIR